MAFRPRHNIEPGLPPLYTPNAASGCLGGPVKMYLGTHEVHRNAIPLSPHKGDRRSLVSLHYPHLAGIHILT